MKRLCKFPNGAVVQIDKICIVHPIRRRDPSVGWTYSVKTVGNGMELEAAFQNEEAAKAHRSLLLEAIEKLHS